MLAKKTQIAALLALATATAAGAVQRHAFVTSIKGSADLSTWPGVTGATALERADSICRARATAGGLANASAYRAWLSTSTTDAYCHVQGLSGKRLPGPCNDALLIGGGPWFSVSGGMFTGTLDELVDLGVIYQPIYEDELGNTPPSNDAFAWTGTASDGTGGIFNCSDWTSEVDSTLGVGIGNALGTAVRWTTDTIFNGACGASLRLLCFEQGIGNAGSFQGWPGALVFVTSATGNGNLQTWPEAHGLVSASAGYEICQTLAAKAGLPSPGSFVPWLSTGLVDARDRITSDGPFNRIDGFPIALTKADLLDGSLFESIHQYEDGRYLQGNDDLVGTGTYADGTRFPLTCSSWTSAEPSSYQLPGVAGIADSRWSSPDSWSDLLFCDRPQRLYCFSNVVTLSWSGFEHGFARWSSKTP